ncbi:Aminopeptidase [Aphelenchoides fujianensis]|nr:Aminopeptidase [Aphelenchoides fujianensis]
MSLNQKSGVDVQAISYVQMAPTLEYAANVTAQCIQSMVALTKTPFPLNKLDIVGLIESGFRNPMDNFGLLTADSAEFGSSNFADNYDLAGQSVITCEGVAGQYFGGLVTPERWGSEWLNIGISTYFAGVAARDQLAPADENILEAFVISERGSAFEEMNYTGAPIVYNESRFDGVVQLGGSIVMRMLEGVVERQVFQQAIASYLDDNQWGNARESDFFRAFETANGNQPLCGDLWITDFLWDFLYQSYFPVVKISFDPTAGYSFTQNSINADDTSTWNIPLFVWSEKTQKVKILWLLKDGGTCGSIQWDLDDRYIFNHRSRTFALFDYSLALWGRLLSIDYSVIDEVTQLGMIIDRQISEQFPRAPLPDSSILGRLLNKILNDNYLVVSPFVVDYALMLFENDTLEDQLFELVNWSPATMRQDMINDFLLINVSRLLV